MPPGRSWLASGFGRLPGVRAGFAAFLPQFMDAHASPLMQTLALGGVFVAIACCTDLIYVLTAGLVAPRLHRAARHAVWGNRIAGTSFIGLGVLTAMGARLGR